MTYLMTAARAATAAAALLAAAPSMAIAYGSGTVPLGTGTYVETFDSLANSGMSSALPNGWRVVEEGTAARVNGTYTADIGSDTAGDIYSYGLAGNTDRALGSLRSGTFQPLFGAVFANGTGSTITDLAFGYTGEQWRNGNASADAFNFQYSLTSTNIADAVDSAAWKDLDSLDFASPNNAAVGALNGNTNSTALTGSLTNLMIGANATFAIRFLDVDASSSDDGLAVDNFTVTARAGAVTPAPAVPEPATWAMMVIGFGLVGGTMRRRRTTVSFA